MSHAAGTVTFQDGTVLHFEYNGTCDVPRPKLWKSSEELHEHWRDDELQKTAGCTCGREPEAVAAFANYGDGVRWSTVACRNCMVIVDTGNPLELLHDHDCPHCGGWASWVEDPPFTIGASVRHKANCPFAIQIT